ncbi:unnamed protein product, partial [marine sediment metagenome]
INFYILQGYWLNASSTAEINFTGTRVAITPWWTFPDTSYCRLRDTIFMGVPFCMPSWGPCFSAGNYPIITSKTIELTRVIFENASLDIKVYRGDLTISKAVVYSGIIELLTIYGEYKVELFECEADKGIYFTLG